MRVGTWLSKEGHHATPQHQACPPPRRTEAAAVVLLNQLWRVLPVEDRHRTLQTLSRVVAQQLAPAPNTSEVTHERS